MTQANEKKPDWKQRVKKLLIYVAVAIACAILLYVLVWFGTQLGLQN